ncbi:MAG: hypothetical protein VB055_00335 [Oscillospiraceae bacterium]|nr:hypothetical protein [Oscillospiraceae bacterium]
MDEDKLYPQDPRDSLPEDGSHAPENAASADSSGEFPNAEDLRPTAEDPAPDSPSSETAQFPAWEASGMYAGFAAPQKPARKKKLLVAVAAAVLVLAALAFGVLAAVRGAPFALLTRGIQNAVKASGSSAFSELLCGVQNGGSAEFSCNTKSFMESAYGYGLDVGVNLKVYGKNNGESSAAVLNTTLNGSELADASLFLDQDALILDSDALLGGEAYGIGLKDAATNLPLSEFAPGGAYDLGEAYDTISELLSGDGTDNAQLRKDSSAFMSEFFAAMHKTLKENAAVTKRAETLSFSGDSIKTTAVEMQLDHDALIAVARDTINFLQENEKLDALLSSYDDYLTALGDTDGTYSSGSESFAEEFRAALDEAETELDDLAENSGDETASVVFYISKSGEQLVAVDFTATDSSETTNLSLACGPSWEAPKEIRLDFDGGLENYSVSYKVTESSSSLYSAALQAQSDGDTVLTGSVLWNKDSGAFDVAVSDGTDGDYGFSGTLEADSKHMDLAVNTITMSGYDCDFDAEFILLREDSMPTAPSYTDLLTMNETEIRNLLTEIQDAVQSLSGISS